MAFKPIRRIAGNMKAVKLKLMVVKEGATFGYDPIYTP